MADKVLAIPQPDRIPQETGYWCGPASCQTALQVLDLWVEERELANEMGTSENGTNHIGLLADAMNKHAGQGQWEAVWMPNDPPSREQCEQFWVELKANIDAGFAMPANWVSPESNHPVAVHGSGPNPGYYGTIYHYVCYTGYGEDESGRFVHVADSGFSPWQYWVTWEQACLLMPPKGYVRSNAAKAAAPAAPPVTALSDAEKLAYAMDESLSLQEYEQLLPHVRASLAACECINEERVAMWLAQIGHESGGLKYFEELADGSQYNGREDLGNRPGTNDGVTYKGRGPIQLTGRTNYTQVSQWAAEHHFVDSPTKFVDEPELLGTHEWGFLGTDWYWVVARPKINAMADARDIEGVTRAINGGLNGFEDRCQRYERAKQVASAFVASAEPPPPPPAPKQDTCLTGRPHHHSENAPTDQQILDIRAEGLLTQSLVYAIAQKLGLDAHGIYTHTRDSF